MGSVSIIRIPATVLLAVLATASPSMGGGLSTQAGEVVIENLQIGQTYNLRDLANLSLIVTNTSEYPVDLRMDLLVPASSELRHQAEPVPSTSWIDLTQSLFELESGAQAQADVIIRIPDDEQYLGKAFQFIVWSHTIVGPGQGMALAYGLKSRFIFTVDPVKAESIDLVTTSDADAVFAVTPLEIYLDDVEIGGPWDVEEHTGIVLTLSNPGQKSRTVQLMSQAVGESKSIITPGFEDTPDPACLTFSESELVIPPAASKSVRMWLNFPTDGDHVGRDYMFIIHGQTVGERVSTGVYSRLYVSVK